MAVKKKAPKKQRAAWGSKTKTHLNEVVVASTNEMFTIEDTPPPAIRGATPQKLALYAKIDRTLLSLKTDQAFVIPQLMRNTVESYLKRNYTRDRWSFSAIADNPSSMRVYRFAWGDKKK